MTLRSADALRAALQRQIEYWEQLPCGADHDADTDELSPSDAAAHVAGLAVRDAKEALSAVDCQRAPLKPAEKMARELISFEANPFHETWVQIGGRDAWVALQATAEKAELLRKIIADVIERSRAEGAEAERERLAGAAKRGDCGMCDGTGSDRCADPLHRGACVCGQACPRCDGTGNYLGPRCDGCSVLLRKEDPERRLIESGPVYEELCGNCGKAAKEQS
jgi:hypothetical protein